MYRLNMVDYRLMVKNAQKNGNHYAWQWARPDEVSHSGPRRSMTNLHFSLLYASRDRHNHNIADIDRFVSDVDNLFL